MHSTIALLKHWSMFAAFVCMESMMFCQHFSILCMSVSIAGLLRYKNLELFEYADKTIYVQLKDDLFRLSMHESDL